MTPAQAKHLRELVIEQVEAERHHAALCCAQAATRGEAYEQRTLAARRVTEYIDFLTGPNL